MEVASGRPTQDRPAKLAPSCQQRPPLLSRRARDCALAGRIVAPTAPARNSPGGRRRMFQLGRLEGAQAAQPPAGGRRRMIAGRPAPSCCPTFSARIRPSARLTINQARARARPALSRQQIRPAGPMETRLPRTRLPFARPIVPSAGRSVSLEKIFTFVRPDARRLLAQDRSSEPAGQRATCPPARLRQPRHDSDVLVEFACFLAPGSSRPGPGAPDSCDSLDLLAQPLLCGRIRLTTESR